MLNDPEKKQSRLVTKDGWLSRTGALTLVLIIATGLIFYVNFRLVSPFLSSITWALAIAVVAYPLHEWIVLHLKHDNFAAGLAVLIVAVVIIVPGIFVGQRLVVETNRGIEALRNQTGSEQWQTVIQKHPKLRQILNLIDPDLDVRKAIEGAVNAIASGLAGLIGSSIWMLIQLLVTLFTLFYLLRDRHAILKTLGSLLPLSQAETQKLFSRVGNIVYATIYGTLMVALLQGTLGGFMFWMLGLPGPLLWGLVMALLALIPVLGAPVVWAPTAVFLAMTGNWGKALILAAWGGILIGSIDNLIYPILVGDRVRMHTLLVFFSVVGGLLLFGTAGLILGPVSVVITSTLMEVWQHRASDE